MGSLKRIVIIIIVILVIGAMLRIVLNRKTAKTAAEKIALPVEVTPALKADVVRSCELVGTITADKTVQIFPETMGRVTKIIAREGSRVNKGERIIAIRNESIGFEFEEAYVTSTISGTVAKILVDVGTTVAPQVPVALVVDISVLKVNFNVAEIDAQCFRPNSTVIVSVDAIPDKKFIARISEISPVVDPLTKTVAVKAIIEQASSGLKPGMTARITFKLGERKNVIAIPADAIVDNSVFVVSSDSLAQRRSIKIGLNGDELVEILEGLNEGEKIVVLGQQRLSGGEKVNPIERTK